MKKIFRFLFIASISVSMICLNACISDEDKDSYGLSNVVTFPVFTLTDGDFVVLTSSGNPFVDPGVVAYADENEVAVETKGSVDPSTPGLYTLNYTAYDKTGKFPVSATRYVLVVNAPLTVDYSGTYALQHATRTGTITVTKVAGKLGWYRASDCWWQASKIPAQFFDLGNGLMLAPGTTSGYGPIDGDVLFNNGTNVLTFGLHITEGINAGVSWTTNWLKQ